MALVKGKRVGLTRNQQRKLDYAAEAQRAQSRSTVKEGSSSATTSRTTRGSRTNHKNGIREANHARRVQEANDRNNTWAKMTPQEQLQALDGRLGKNVGAVKQRARLQAAIVAASIKKTVETQQVGKAKKQ